MIAYGVMTTDRGVDYLSGTLDSLAAAGFHDPLIIYDAKPKLGIKPTFKRILQELIQDVPPVNGWVAVFQDDIQVARGLRAWLESNLEDCVQSLYCSSVQDTQLDGWRTVPLQPTATDPMPWRHSLGACAIVMPSLIAQMFLWNDPEFNKNNCLGAALGKFCYREALDFRVHCPSLVQHIGEISCHDGHPFTAERRAARFCEDVRNLGRTAVLEASVSHSPDHRTPETVSTDQGVRGLGE